MQLSLVSYLDQYATQQIRQLQQTMSEITGSTASLSSWAPHITLGDGVDVTRLELDDIVDEITQVARMVMPFQIALNGFSSLDSRPMGVEEASTPYAIFANVIIDQELTDLVSKIDEVTTARSIWYHMPRPYLPHVTLAFRDLSESGYANGLEYLNSQTIQLLSMIDHIALVQKLPDSDDELLRIPLGG